MRNSGISAAVLAAMVEVSNLDRYSLAHFEWQAEYSSAIEAFHKECAEIRASERDPSIRADLYDQATDKLDNTLLAALDAIYPIGADGKRAERVSAPPAPPAIVVNNEANENKPEEPPVSAEPVTEEPDNGEPVVEPEVKLAQA